MPNDASALHRFEAPGLELYDSGLGRPLVSEEIRLADVDADGVFDLVVVCEDSLGREPRVAVRLGLGGGAFGPTSSFVIPTGDTHIPVFELFDATGDGVLDAVSIELRVRIDGEEYAWLGVMPGDGVGGFSPPEVTLLESLDYFRVITWSDLNGDGLMDLLFSKFPRCAVHVSMDTGPAAWGEPGAYPGTPGITSLVVRDFNGDEAPDVATLHSAPQNVGIMLGAGDGTLLPEQRYGRYWEWQKIEAGDVNGDGHVDLVGLNSFDSSLNLFRGRGDGSFESNYRIPIGDHEFVWFTLFDTNFDGVDDIVAGTHRNLLHFMGDGSGGFREPRIYPSGISATYRVISRDVVALGDINQDGIPDLVGPADSGVGFMLGREGGWFSPGMSEVGSSYAGILRLLFDEDKDGVLDMLVSSFSQLSLIRGLGDGLFGDPQAFGTLDGVLESLDLNADGREDIVVTDGRQILGAYIAGDDGYTEVGPPDPPFSSFRVEFGDFDGDGIPDAVYVPSDSELVAHRGLGDGTFEPLAITGVERRPNQLATGDLNHDGHLDLLGMSSDAVVFFPGNGDGTFGEALVMFSSFSSGDFLHLDDVDSDGSLDMIIGERVYWGTNDAVPTFADSALPSIPRWHEILVVDIDADGNNDVVTSQTNENHISIVRGAGNRQFHEKIIYRGLGFNTEFVVGDMDGDRDLDLVVEGNSNMITMFNGPAVGRCAAGLDQDGDADIDDIDAFVEFFLDQFPINADVNNDRDEDIDDISAFVEAFIAGCP